MAASSVRVPSAASAAAWTRTSRVVRSGAPVPPFALEQGLDGHALRTSQNDTAARGAGEAALEAGLETPLADLVAVRVAGPDPLKLFRGGGGDGAQQRPGELSRGRQRGGSVERGDVGHRGEDALEGGVVLWAQHDRLDELLPAAAADLAEEAARVEAEELGQAGRGGARVVDLAYHGADALDRTLLHDRAAGTVQDRGALGDVAGCAEALPAAELRMNERRRPAHLPVAIDLAERHAGLILVGADARNHPGEAHAGAGRVALLREVELLSPEPGAVDTAAVGGKGGGGRPRVVGVIGRLTVAAGRPVLEEGVEGVARTRPERAADEHNHERCAQQTDGEEDHWKLSARPARARRSQ